MALEGDKDILCRVLTVGLSYHDVVGDCDTTGSRRQAANPVHSHSWERSCEIFQKSGVAPVRALRACVATDKRRGSPV